MSPVNDTTYEYPDLMILRGSRGASILLAKYEATKMVALQPTDLEIYCTSYVASCFSK